jgi:hypothetical protein
MDLNESTKCRREFWRQGESASVKKCFLRLRVERLSSGAVWLQKADQSPVHLIPNKGTK